ncbi:hypothetical protein SO802_001631 [Lithocarpus litseifolius]|uniref:DUF642 domain-containing protein n=1 Tax=Lithocarpus litseifolius TaxID=425828 RepID=A0AAW2DVJ3_9ROSI
MQLEIILLSLFFVGLASADLLQNPDFESPPSNLTGNSTSSVVPLSQNNTIPGWTFEGTVNYVKASQNISLPGNGHGIQLGQDGKINQTFTANGNIINYLLTFTLAPGGQNCSANADMEVSTPDSTMGEPINLVFQSQTTETDPNSICWPVLDTLHLKGIAESFEATDNLLLNGGFEYGPDFLSNSTEGILLDQTPSPVQSPLLLWSVQGTVKYIDSKHYFVPQGNAAIEIVSGVSAGIQIPTILNEGSTYNLNFTLGDANDTCVGDFLVGALAGSTAKNFSLKSNGTGSAEKLSLTFKAGPSPTLISFLSYKISQTKDGVFCGPLIDDVVLLLRASSGLKLEMQLKVLISLYILVAILQIHWR